MIKYLGVAVAVLGFLLVLGVAGADCDGKCMENSMSLTDIMLYTAVGFLMMISGAIVAVRSE
jgi:hypothetical protein